MEYVLPCNLSQPYSRILYVVHNTSHALKSKTNSKYVIYVLYASGLALLKKEIRIYNAL
jgi:hypothetical protein